MLNAKNHEREALIIENAGVPGAVTIATNMAGRGVDIKLGEGVADLGGLYVLGTERHESRRIDNQLRGRSGRQGDPGESRFYLSAQDEVIRLFAGERIYKILDSRFGPPDGEPIEAKMLTSRIEGAQKKVEEFHFVNRKNVVKYDDVLNEQREQVYATRREILEGEDLHEMVVGWFEDVVEAAVDAHTGGGGFAEDWDWEGMWVSLQSIYPIRSSLATIDREHITREELLDRIFDDAISSYEGREKEWGEELTRNLERWVVLQVLDVRWREHLDNMDYMRQGIGLRGYAQKDPLVEYRAEGAVDVQRDGLPGEAGDRAGADARRGGGRGRGPVRPLAAEHAPGSTPTSTTRPRRSRRSRPPGAAGTARAGGGRRLPGRRAAPRRPRARRRPQRPVLVRLGQEVQEVPWRITATHREPRSLDDLRAAVEEIRAQLHWVRDYL